MSNASSRRIKRVMGLSLVLWLTSGSARADVFRCEREGRLTFTDTPCDAAARPVEIAEPSTIESTAGADLANDYDQRRARERRGRDDADARWLSEHAAAKADEERIRKAFVEGRVVAGMSPQQVRQIWGEPDEIQAQVDRNASRERWVYRDARGASSGRRSVSFEDERVAGAGSRSGNNSKARKPAGDGKKQSR
jgi:hypothetical protein